MLLLRSLVAWFWRHPYKKPLVHWGTQLHDRYMLPHFIAVDIRDVTLDLQNAGYDFKTEWIAPFLEFRFPHIGSLQVNDLQLELHQAIEPWHVLGEEITSTGTARYVDSSVERLQVRLTGAMGDRYALTCNDRRVPLRATETPGEMVAGIRYRAWNPPSALHPTIGVQAPLIFDIVDTWNSRAVGGCTYHVGHPGGRNYDTLPVNANEAEARRVSRFWNHGYTPGRRAVGLTQEESNKDFPFTLDLRWQARQRHRKDHSG